ncbi:MAG: hypothetical protein AABX11_07640 [Nanoarchaeota archaeon]
MNTKRGQVTIFIILALALIAIIALFFMYPQIKGVGGIDAIQNPKVYLEKCLEPSLTKLITQLSANGGDIVPQGFLEYNGQKIKYLCYTSEYYKTCTVQQPLIKDHFDDVITSEIKNSVQNCMTNLIAEYESKGWSVSSGESKVSAEIVPNYVDIRIDSPMTLTKDTSRTIKTFDLSFMSNMYEILYIATSIVEFESKLGDAETTAYLNYYPNVRIKKNQLSDGSVIYNIENVITEESFTFASRSLPWPPGYGGE